MHSNTIQLIIKLKQNYRTKLSNSESIRSIYSNIILLIIKLIKHNNKIISNIINLELKKILIFNST